MPRPIAITKRLTATWLLRRLLTVSGFAAHGLHHTFMSPPPVFISLALLESGCAGLISSEPEREATAAQEQSDPSQGDNGKIVSIPLRITANDARIAATINGAGPFWLALDTGFGFGGVLLFNDERVVGLNLPVASQSPSVFGVGKENQSSGTKLVSDVSVSLGGLDLPHTTALLFALDLGRPPGLDGVIGPELFMRYVVRFDMDRHLMQLYDPATWTPPPGGCVVALEETGPLMFANARVSIGTPESQPVKMFLDLGASDAMELVSRSDGDLRVPPITIDAPLGLGTSGIMLGKVGRARRVELGDLVFSNVIVGFPSSDQVFNGDTASAGMIGYGILSRSNPTIDYVGRRLVVEANEHFADPFEWEMAGLSCAWQPDGSMRIMNVMSNSPADRAGLRTGDNLRAIDGVTLESIGQDGVRTMLTTDGVERSFEVIRSGQSITKRIRLQRQI